MRDPVGFLNDGNTWASAFAPIQEPYEIVWVKSFDEFTNCITNSGLPDAICFDHDLGEDIAREKVTSGISKRSARKGIYTSI